MGKLHTLRRAIQRNPDNFIWEFTTIRGETIRYAASSVYETRGGWTKDKHYWAGHRYRGFVYKVLKELGYKDIYKW